MTHSGGGQFPFEVVKNNHKECFDVLIPDWENTVSTAHACSVYCTAKLYWVHKVEALIVRAILGNTVVINSVDGALFYC